MKRILNFFKVNRWAIFSGILMGTSYIPFPPWALLFCWVPLWLNIAEDNSLKSVLLKSWLTQFILTLIGFYWISYVSHEFAFMPWSVSVLVLIAFAALAHLYIPAAAGLAWLVKKKYSLSASNFFILLACLQNLGEAYWPSIFSWNLGYPVLWAKFSLYHWADTIGFLGISWLIHIAQALIASAMYTYKSSPRRSSYVYIFLFFIFLIILNFTGENRSTKWQGNKTFNVTFVQANIGNLEKIYAEKGMGYQRDILDKYFRLSWQALRENPATDFFIWPESAVPEYLDAHNNERRYSQLFREELKRLNKPLITGAYSNDPPESIPRNDYNALFMFDENGIAISEAYHKTHLLIFGEYVPLGNIFPILRKWNPGGEGFGVGSGPQLINWKQFKIAPQICYDSLYPFFSAELTRNGADFFVNVTNDSWFGPYFEPDQHLYMTLARAIENRRPLLRSTNTGITTLIDAQGNIALKSPIGKEWAQSYDVPYLSEADTTFYTQNAVWLSLLPLMLALVILTWSYRRNTK